jgi:hypothetical protein
MTETSLDRVESPPSTARSRLSLFPWVLALVALLFGLALLVSPPFERLMRDLLRLEAPQGATDAGPRQQSLTSAEQIEQLRARIKFMETQPVAPAAGGPLDAAVLGALDDRLTELSTRMERLDRRSSAALANADRAEGMLLALAARRAIETGRPLGVIEGMLRDRFGRTQPKAVATLITAAQTPVTLAGLSAEFDRLAPALREPGSEESFLQGVRRELGSLFVVSRGPERPVSIDDRVSYARARLEMGDVAGALAQVSRLPAAARRDAARWRAQAQTYVAARDAVDALETVALLAPPPATDETVVPLPMEPEAR